MFKQSSRWKTMMMGSSTDVDDREIVPLTIDQSLSNAPSTSSSSSSSSSASSSSSSYAYCVSFSAGISGLLFGYDIGIIDAVLKMPSFMSFFGSGTIDKGTGEIVETDDQANIDGNIVSTFLVGCVGGSILSSILADWIGRKRSITVGALIFTVGGILQAVSINLSTLYIARVLSGVSIGLLSSITPIYLSEISPAAERGRMVSIQQLMITIGILAASVVNAVLYLFVNGDIQWRSALGVQGILGALLLVAVSILPFSPRWLMSKGRETEAIQIIARLRGVPGQYKHPLVVTEIDDIKNTLATEQAVGEATWSEILCGQKLWSTVGRIQRNPTASTNGGTVSTTVVGSTNVKLNSTQPTVVHSRVKLAAMLQMFQQLTGINFLLYFAADLFARIGLDRSHSATTLVIVNSTILIIGTLPGLWAIEVWGRRKLLLYGAFGMTLCHLFVCICITITDLTSVSSIAWLAVAFMFSFTFIFSATWGPVVWVVQNEILPLRARAKGVAAATFMNWAMNSIIGKATPLIVVEIEQYTYAMFAVFCLISAGYTYLYVPETKGITLEGMDTAFMQHYQWRKGKIGGTHGTNHQNSSSLDNIMNEEDNVSEHAGLMASSEMNNNSVVPNQDDTLIKGTHGIELSESTIGSKRYEDGT